MIYTAIFTPYVAAFQLNEPDFDKRSRSFGEDPIVVIDMIGNIYISNKSIKCETATYFGSETRTLEFMDSSQEKVKTLGSALILYNFVYYLKSYILIYHADLFYFMR